VTSNGERISFRKRDQAIVRNGHGPCTGSDGMTGHMPHSTRVSVIGLESSQSRRNACSRHSDDRALGVVSWYRVRCVCLRESSCLETWGSRRPERLLYLQRDSLPLCLSGTRLIFCFSSLKSLFGGTNRSSLCLLLPRAFGLWWLCSQWYSLCQLTTGWHAWVLTLCRKRHDENTRNGTHLIACGSWRWALLWSVFFSEHY